METAAKHSGPRSEEAGVVSAERNPSQKQHARSPIDWQVVSSLTGGDRDLLIELMELFPVESAKRLIAIREAIDSEDAEVLTRSAHTLKGTASCFGARELVACALRVEELGRSARLADARECIPRLEAETARLIEALEQEQTPN